MYRVYRVPSLLECDTYTSTFKAVSNPGTRITFSSIYHIATVEVAIPNTRLSYKFFYPAGTAWTVHGSGCGCGKTSGPRRNLVFTFNLRRERLLVR
jgi:hypothetical protein